MVQSKSLLPSQMLSRVLGRPFAGLHSHDYAFISAKQLLSFVLELVHPQCNAPISLAVDASDSHIGAVQQHQLLDKSWSPLAFFSKKLSNTEKKYSAFNRELLAA